jgi:hypothetical protein
VKQAFSFAKDSREEQKPEPTHNEFAQRILREVICMKICTTVCDAIQIDGRAES